MIFCVAENTLAAFIAFDLLILVVAIGCLVFSFNHIKMIKAGKRSSQWEITTAKLKKVYYSPTPGKDSMEDTPYKGLYLYTVNGKNYEYAPTNCYYKEDGVPEAIKVVYNINEPSKVYHGSAKEYLFPMIVGGCLLIFFILWTYNVIVNGLPKNIRNIT